MPKRGLAQCANLRGLGKKEGELILQCTLWNTLAMKKILKKLMTIFNDFVKETKNSGNSYQLGIERSSYLQLFFSTCVPGVLGQKASKFIKKRPQHRCFAVKFAKFYRKPFFTKTPTVAASKFFSIFWSCINTCFILIIDISMSLE